MIITTGNGDGLVDVTMGSYDGAEIADLISFHILDILRKETRSQHRFIKGQWPESGAQ